MLYIPRSEEGQGLVEYALILVLVAIIVIVIIALFGTGVGNLYSNVINQI
jgi:pilus assembly protein Flp/PilA